MDQVGVSKPNISITPKFNFLEAFCEYCQCIEVPIQFAVWCALGTVSGVMGRRFWYDFGAFQHYTNMGIILIAGSGVMRKSTSIEVSQRLINRMSPVPDLLDEKATPEAIMQDLASAKISDDAELIMSRTSTRILFAEELTFFLNQRSYEAGITQLLIKLFDCRDVANKTITRGRIRAQDPCLIMIGASTVDYLRKAMPAESIGGGLTSRILFVYSDKPSRPIPFPVVTDYQRYLFERMIEHLNKLYQTSGILRLSKEALQIYEEMYVSFRQSDLYKDSLTQGYASRRCGHVLKIAAVLAMCEPEMSLEISAIHITRAIEMISNLEIRLPYVLQLIASADCGVLLTKIVETLKETKTKVMSKANLFSKFSHQYQLRFLEEALIALTTCRRVEIVNTTSGYQLVKLLG